MSNTYKDKPERLGGQKHKYCCGSKNHGRFTRDMRRQTRHDLNRQFARTGELITKSRWQYAYYD